VQLKDIALSVKPRGQIGALKVQGRIHTAGDDVVSVEIEGNLDQLTLAGGISAAGPRVEGQPRVVVLCVAVVAVLTAWRTPARRA
jgi:hypothetical protein